MKKCSNFVLAGLVFVLFSTCTPPDRNGIQPVARVDASSLKEISGISKSSQWPDVYWAHNDSGGDARIFALTNLGRQIIPSAAIANYYTDAPEEGNIKWPGFAIAMATNIDWEDITLRDNYLYIADMGNNRNRRQDLGIYRLPEFDPTNPISTEKVVHIPVKYPEQSQFPARQWHFDSESLFAWDGSLYLITKHRVANRRFSWEAGANLYRLDSENSDQTNVLTRVDSHPLITAATGADISPDGQTLAVVSLTALWLFDKPAEGDMWLSSTSQKIELETRVFRQVEAVGWIDNSKLILINEQRDLFHIDLATR